MKMFPRISPDPNPQPIRIPAQYGASPPSRPDGHDDGDENHNCVRKTSGRKSNPGLAESPAGSLDPRRWECQAAGYHHRPSESPPPLPAGVGILPSTTPPGSAASTPAGNPSGLLDSSRRPLGFLCSPGRVSMPESCSPCRPLAPSDQTPWVRFSSTPPPLDAPSLLPPEFHPKERKKGPPEIKKVAASPRARASEPHHRLHVRPFIPPRQDYYDLC